MFFNANYNHGSPEGQYKFKWGIRNLDLSNPLLPQIFDESEIENVFNFNVTALNNVDVQEEE
jgi:hypothetical protein